MSDIPIRNRILSALPAKELKRIYSKLEPIRLTYKETIARSDDRIRHAYFPEEGAISLLSAASGRFGLEGGINGSEGMVGLPLYVGSLV